MTDCRSQLEQNDRTYRCVQRAGHVGNHEGPGAHMNDWCMWPHDHPLAHEATP